MYRGLVTVVLLMLASVPGLALEDPMRPSGSAAMGRPGGAGRATLELTSTMVSRERRAATINGKVVQVGERIGDARVVEILPSLVRLRKGNRELVLRLLPAGVKKPAVPDNVE